MSDAQPIRPDTTQQHDLGAEVVRCRRLSGANTLQSQGFLLGWLLYYVLYSLMMLPYIALMTAMLIFLTLGYSIEQMIGPAFFVVFGSFYLAICYFVYVWPHRHQFILHEKGSRIRCGFKRLHCPFESIQAIAVGRAPSSVEGALRNVVGVLQPGDANWINQLDRTALTFVLGDGTLCVFKAILTRFEAADVEKLSQELVRRVPRLGAETTGNESTAGRR